MKKYKVYDLYDGVKDTIGYANTMKEVKELAKERYEETDGECIIYYAELDTQKQKYNFGARKFLATF